MATSSANSSAASVKVLGPVNAEANPRISEVTTITAAAASTRRACLWAERVNAEATRSAMATTKSPAAALSESKPISSALGAAKSSSIRRHSTQFGPTGIPYTADPHAESGFLNVR
ncbi:hypothetical protein BH20ACT12_BH20ACT12_04380 [soil metagenome]